MKKIGYLTAAALAGALGATGTPAADQFISIGTGGVTGVYYPTGGAICRLVNKMRKETGIRCSAESTGGSIYNINTIRAGELEFGVAQSDWQYHAYHGTSKFEDKGKFEDLRAVFSVHPEPVTIIARDDSGVANITDLKGKRVNIGNVGSGTRGTWEVIEEAMGWQRSDLKLASELKSAETGQAVCDNKIDAYFWLVGHPSALTQESLATCPTHLVNATGAVIDKLVADHSYYRTADHSRRDVQQRGGRHDLRRGRDLRHQRHGSGGGRVHRRQGGVRQLRSVHEAAPRVREPERAGDDQRFALRTAARRSG